MTVKEIIIQVINEHQGIKATELVVEVFALNANDNANYDAYEDSLTELIKNREIVEVEYTLPQMDYRVKSLYFPKETVIVVSGNN